MLLDVTFFFFLSSCYFDKIEFAFFISCLVEEAKNVSLTFDRGFNCDLVLNGISFSFAWFFFVSFCVPPFELASLMPSYNWLNKISFWRKVD